jgi:hypothetical protein
VTLFVGADTFAPGQVGTQDLGRSGVARVPLWNLAGLTQTNVLLGLLGLLVAAYLAHRWLGAPKGRKR